MGCDACPVAKADKISCPPSGPLGAADYRIAGSSWVHRVHELEVFALALIRVRLPATTRTHSFRKRRDCGIAARIMALNVRRRLIQIAQSSRSSMRCTYTFNWACNATKLSPDSGNPDASRKKGCKNGNSVMDRMNQERHPISPAPTALRIPDKNV